jgi:hypothetical protein
MLQIKGAGTWRLGCPNALVTFKLASSYYGQSVAPRWFSQLPRGLPSKPEGQLQAPCVPRVRSQALGPAGSGVHATQWHHVARWQWQRVAGNLDYGQFPPSPWALWNIITQAGPRRTKLSWPTVASVKDPQCELKFEQEPEALRA